MGIDLPVEAEPHLRAVLERQPVVLTRVNKEGTFLGKCAELCGVDHSRMLFNVKVVSPERYEAHLRELAEKGQTGYVPAGIEQTDHEKNRETNQL